MRNADSSIHGLRSAALWRSADDLRTCNPSNICAAFYTISTDSVFARFLCISRASCCHSQKKYGTAGLNAAVLRVQWWSSRRSFSCCWCSQWLAKQRHQHAAVSSINYRVAQLTHCILKLNTKSWSTVYKYPYVMIWFKKSVIFREFK